MRSSSSSESPLADLSRSAASKQRSARALPLTFLRGIPKRTRLLASSPMPNIEAPPAPYWGFLRATTAPGV